MIRHISFSIATLLVTLALFGAPLWTSAQGTSTPAADPAVKAILSAASAQLANTQTVRFELKVDGETFIDDDNTLQLLEAKGELVRPDSVRTEFKVKVLGAVTIGTSLIIIGDSRWSTDLITGKWGDAPNEFGYDPSILFDNQGGIGPVMDRVENAQQLPDESMHGRDAYHIQAAVDAETIGPLTSNTMEGSPITVDLWIDKETSDLLRATLAEPDSVSGHEPATWTLDLTDQGSEITIEPPE